MIKTFKIIFITIIIFLTLDFSLGNLLIDTFKKKNIYITTEQTAKQNSINEKKFRIKDKNFSHTFKKNFKGTSFYGNKKNLICTNEHGFRKNCIKKNNPNNYDYFFIGDSFTEGVGLNYPETFVGIFENKTEYNVANLGVSSYSPIIYYHKLKYFLDNGLKTKHVILYLDVSDVEDEIYRYECNKSVCYKEIKTQTSNKKLNKIDYLKKSIKKNLKITFTVLKHTKNLLCINKLTSICYDIYDENFPRYSWINDFREYTNTNGVFKKPFDQNVFYLKKISNLLKVKNIKFSLAIYPWPGNILYNNDIDDYQNYWENFCKDKCVFFINHFQDFDALKDTKSNKQIIKENYFYGDVHFNETGNLFIANKLIKLIN